MSQPDNATPAASGQPDSHLGELATAAAILLLLSHGDDALTLEHRAAEQASRPVRVAARDLSRWVTRQWVLRFGSLDARPDPVAWSGLAPAVVQQLRAVQPDPAPVVAAYASRALALGTRQGAATLALPVTPAVPDPVTERMAAATTRTVAARYDTAEQLLTSTPVQSRDDAMTALAPTHAAAADVERDARTIVNTALNVGGQQVAEANGADLMWESLRDACVVCLALSGTVVGHDEDFPAHATFGKSPTPWWTPDGTTLLRPPRHPRCVIGSTRVSTPGQGVVAGNEPGWLSATSAAAQTSATRVHGSGRAASALAQPSGNPTWPIARATTERDFVGDVVIFRTARGYELTCTPNHPIATRSGWVPASELDVGDHVLSSTAREWRVGPVDPDVDDIPPTIEEVAQAFPVGLLSMPLSPEDFHGDGAGSEVCVVRTDSRLTTSHHSLCREHLSEYMLSLAGVQPEPFSVQGVGAALLEGVPTATDGVVGGSRETGSLFRTGLGHAAVHGFASVAGCDAVLDEDAPDDLPADSEGFCEHLLASSSDVTLDEVIDIRTVPFEGHVYNLDTPEGWYIGNGIVTHNCRCRCVPYYGHAGPPGSLTLPEALKREAQRSILKGWSLPSESERVRVAAAERLLARGSNLPKTVQQVARDAVKRGRFIDRTVPHG